MKIYVASSWKNIYHPVVIEKLRELIPNISVYNYRTDSGFHWSDIDDAWEAWTIEEYVSQLYKHPIAITAYDRDIDALVSADVVILILPSDNSSHLELGYAVGAAKHTAILLYPDSDGQVRPDLMYKMADLMTSEFQPLVDWIRTLLD